MINIWTVLPVVFFVIRLAIMIALHVVPSPYQPIRNAFSDYAVGRTHRLAMAASISNALGWASLALAVFTSSAAWDYRVTATIMLAALTVLSLVVILVPTDLPGAKLTPRGIAHYVVAIATFALAYSLTGNASRWAEAVGPAWIGTMLVVLHWVALAGLIGLCAGLVLPKIRPIFGGLERVFLFAITLFYLLFSVFLMIS